MYRLQCAHCTEKELSHLDACLHRWRPATHTCPMHCIHRSHKARPSTAWAAPLKRVSLMHLDTIPHITMWLTCNILHAVRLKRIIVCYMFSHSKLSSLMSLIINWVRDWWFIIHWNCIVHLHQLCSPTSWAVGCGPVCAGQWCVCCAEEEACSGSSLQLG